MLRLRLMLGLWLSPWIDKGGLGWGIQVNRINPSRLVIDLTERVAEQKSGALTTN